MTDEPRLPDIPEPARDLPLRISDAERNKAVAFLRHHCGEGRLTLDEFSDRVGLVFEAMTAADLEAVTRDLPAIPMPRVEAVEPLATSTGVRRRGVSRFTFACMGGGQRRGRWRLEGHHLVVVFMGGSQLDLRGAEIVGDEVTITIVAFMGGAQVIVPEGVAVELSGAAFMGGKSTKVNENVARIPGTPLVRVQAYPIMGGVAVRSKPSKSARQLHAAERAQYRDERAQYRDERQEQRNARHAQRQAEREKWRAEKEAMRTAAEQLKHRVAREVREQVERAAAPPSPPGARSTPPASSTSAGLPASPGRTPQGLPPFASPERLREWLGSLAGTWDQIRTQMPPEGTVTIVFSDIEGFTSLNERIGDRAIQDILHDHNSIIRGQLAAHAGFEVKSQGDGFMMAFSGATRALRCAVGIQRELRAYNRSRPDDVLVRMGLHTGDAIREANDFLGHTVNLAARIADHAEGGQILTSALLRELCTGGGEFVFDEGREVELRGLTGAHRLFSVKWE